jgi:isoquinoline 1-oxidoreductase beta subunit
MGAALFGAGAVFSLTLPGCGSKRGPAAHENLHFWVKIDADNIVTLRVPQAELGQGATTTIAQLLAEELNLDYAALRTEFYDPTLNLLNGNVFVHTPTLGSQAAALLFDPARIAGAQIRTMLLQAAAKRMGVSTDSVETENGDILHRPTDRHLKFSAVAADAALLPIPAAETVRLKAAHEWRLIGKPIPRRDGPDKVAGRAVYGIDVSHPGMKFAAISQSPIFGGRLASYEETAVRSLPGVRAVISINGGAIGFNAPAEFGGDDWGMDDAVAVVADTWWQAHRALDALPIHWRSGTSDAFTSDNLRREMQYALKRGGFPLRVDGDFDKAIKSASRVLEADYEYPFMEHAPLEPMNCTARFADGHLELWAPTEYGDEAVRVAARLANIPVAHVKLNLPYIGGGFGRRLANDYVSQVTQIALRMPGIPIKLIWTREECFRRGYYPAPAMARFKGGLDSAGRLVALQCTGIVAKKVDQSAGITRFPHVIDNVSVGYATVDSPLPFGVMRGGSFAQFVWMHQGFLDELAHAAGHDSVDFHRQLLDPARIPQSWTDRDYATQRMQSLQAVLADVAERSRWSATLPARRGRGVSVSDLSYHSGDRTSATAAVVEVELDAKGWLRVTKVFVTIQCGVAINPSIVESLIQGGVGWALSNALYSEITVKEGQVVQGNFDAYPILSIDEMPRVEVHIMPSTQHPTGAGDDAVPVTIAALINAIAAAGGPRIRSLPLIKHRPLSR